MKRKDYTVLIIAVLGISAIIIYTYYFSGKDKNKYAWVKTYNDGLKQPYDFGLFKSLLKDKAGLDFEEIDNKLKNKLEDHAAEDSSTYVFIGQYCYLSKPEINAMLDFAAAGHQVILIAEGMPDTLFQVLSYYSKPISINRFDDNSVQVETYRYQSPGHRFNFRSFDHDSTENIDWFYLDEAAQLSYYYGETGNRYISQGKINGHLNYAKFRVGNGFLSIHSSPMLFTNYAMRNDSGFNYVDEVFSNMNTNHVLYDVYSRVYKDDSEDIQRKSDSPLSYILKQPALKWAWYLFVVAVILFFLFKAKRRQRIIPVLEQKRNTSINFIETLSGLFYKDATHRQMAETRMSLFLFFLRNKLRVSTHDLNFELIKLVSLRSKVGEGDIRAIFNFYADTVQNTKRTFSGEDLIAFYNLTDTFYKLYNSKK